MANDTAAAQSITKILTPIIIALTGRIEPILENSGLIQSGSLDYKFPLEFEKIYKRCVKFLRLVTSD